MEESKAVYGRIERERVINIRALLGECLRKWWVIALSAIVLAILLAGYQYYKDQKLAGNTLAEEDLPQLSDPEQTAVDNLINLWENLIQSRNYMNTSPLMQIDPYHENQYTLQYYINTGYETNYSGVTKKDYTQDLKVGYESYINSGTIGLALHDMGLSKEDGGSLAELISSGFALDGNSSASTLPETGDASFMIKVIGQDKAQCKELADQVKVGIDAYKEAQTERVGSHELVLVGETAGEVVDPSLVDLQVVRVGNLSDLQKRVDDLSKSMSQDQLTYLDVKLKDMGVSRILEPEVKLSYKSIAMGLLGGIVLSVLVILFLYLKKGTIYSGEDVAYLYGMRLLGTLDGTDQRLRFAMANLKASLNSDGDKKIYLTGSRLFAFDTLELKEALEKQFAGQEREFTFGESFIHQAQALERLAEYDAVIFLEKENVSTYKELAKEYEICLEYGKTVAGIIMFG